MSIYYVSHNEIDLEKWDKTIMHAFNGNVYGFSWYLDRVTLKWDALVEDDYARIMPLPHRHQFSLQYVFQPFLARQLGVYSRKSLYQEDVERFLHSIPKNFRYVNTNLNLFNAAESTIYKCQKLYSYELDVIPPYNTLFKKYSSDFKKKLKKAYEAPLHIFRHVSPEDFMRFIRTHLIRQFHWVTEEHLLMIKSLARFGSKNNIAHFTAAYNKYHEATAMVFWLKTHHRAIYLVAAASQEGYASHALPFLIDDYIRQNAEKNLLLDFDEPQGSGQAALYKALGALPCPFYNCRRNNLPLPIRLLVTNAAR